LGLFHPTAGRRHVTRTVCDGRSSRESLAGARTKGIGARLGLDTGRAPGLHLRQAVVRTRWQDADRETADQGITTGSRATLRFTLPDRLARKLRLGQRVMLRA